MERLNEILSRHMLVTTKNNIQDNGFFEKHRVDSEYSDALAVKYYRARMRMCLVKAGNPLRRCGACD